MERKIIKLGEAGFEVIEHPKHDYSNNVVNNTIRFGNGMLNKLTGELYEINPYSTKYDSRNNLRSQLTKFRRKLTYNGSRHLKSLYFVTFVYTVSKVYEKFSAYLTKFLAKLRRKFKGIKHMGIEEPQGNGYYHFHCILWNEENNLKLDVFTLNNMWASSSQPPDLHKIKTYKDLVDISWYMVNYFDDDSEKVKRLNLIPAGANIIRQSKGLDNPVNINPDEFENVESCNKYLESDRFGNHFEFYLNEKAS